VVLPVYSLLLPILGFILLISGLFHLLKSHKGHLSARDQYLSVCICGPSCYLPISSHLGLWPLRFLVTITRCGLLLPIWRLIKGLFGLLKAHEEPLGAPDQYIFLLCLHSPSCYLPISCQLRFEPLRFWWWWQDTTWCCPFWSSFCWFGGLFGYFQDS
jgi:hypothetical protein